MKKTIVSTLVMAAVAAPVFAGAKIDVYNESSTEGDRASKQGIILGLDADYALGTAFGEMEATTNKDLEFTGGFKFELTDIFYLKPSVGYVFNLNKSKDSFSTNLGTFDATELGDDKKYEGYTVDMDLHLNHQDFASDVVKVGLEVGAELENGFFTSFRYRLEQEVTAESAKISAHGHFFPKDGRDGADFEETRNLASVKGQNSRIGRADLLMGYAFDGVTLTAKAIRKDQLNKNFNDLYGKKHRYSSEIKATLTSFDGVAPYLQLSSGKTTRKGFDDNKIKLGAAFTF
ncbi:hypothetical protein [Vibrio jasicida]|uniref:hypothetical protein n=1 Tax=Vibrio jasicida TaxID=766224 RepID=UPI000CE434A6|nr:hypothetical protein [Vibrio jasicida]